MMRHSFACAQLVGYISQRQNMAIEFTFILLQKKFMKGLRVFGKNFFRIRKEFLPEKETVGLLIGRNRQSF